MSRKLMISCFVLFVFLVTSGFPTKPASCLDQRISTANKFNPNLAYDYLQNLADRHPEQITSVVIWLAENVLSSKAMNSLKKSFAENLTRSYNVTVWYIGEAFSFIHLYAKAMEVEKIASYELVSEVNIHGDFVLAHKCLDVSVPTIRADRKVNIGYNGSGIRIAILDSGINKTHPDLDDLDDDPTTNDPKVILERDFTGENITIDPDGHGTECAGVAAGTGNASRGIYRGVAPGAWLLNGRIYRSDGFCDANWWTDAIDWATANGADVISLSSGITYFSGGAQIRTDGTYPPSPAADRAVDHGVVFVAGAGNKGIPHNPWNYIEAPGDAFDVITAGVSDDMNTQSMQDDVIWDSSPKGPTGDGRSKPDILAPGVGIIAPSAGYASGDYYSSDTGSSLSIPHVAGVAALLLQSHQGWTPGMVKQAIKSTAVLNDNLQSLTENGRGKGIVDAYRAVTCATDEPANNPDHGLTGGCWAHDEELFENGTIKTNAYGVILEESRSIANLTKDFNLTTIIRRPTFTFGFHEIGSYLGVIGGYAGLNATMRLFNSSGHVLFKYEEPIHSIAWMSYGADCFDEISYTYDGTVGYGPAYGSPYSIEYGFVAYAKIESSYARVTTHCLSISIMGIQGLGNPSFEQRLDSVYKPACWLNNTGWRELRADMNGDGYCNAADQALLSVSYGSHVGDLKYDWRCDLDGNGYIGSYEFALLGMDFGKSAVRLDGSHSWYANATTNYQTSQWLCDYDVSAVKGKHFCFGFYYVPNGPYDTTAEIFYILDGGSNTVVNSGWSQMGDWHWVQCDVYLPSSIKALKVTIRDVTPNFKARMDWAYVDVE